MKLFSYLVVLMTSWTFAQNWVDDKTWDVFAYSGATADPSDRADLVTGGVIDFTSTTVSGNWNGAGFSTTLSDFSLGGADTISMTYQSGFAGAIVTLRDVDSTKWNYTIPTNGSYTTVKLSRDNFTPGYNQPETFNWGEIDAFIVELGYNDIRTGNIKISNLSIISSSDQPEVVKPLGDISGIAQNGSVTFNLDTVFSVGSGSMNFSASSENLETSVSGSTLTATNNTGSAGRFCVKATATHAVSSKQASDEHCYIFGSFSMDGNDLYASWVPYNVGVGSISPVLTADMLQKEGVEDILDLSLNCSNDNYCEGGVKIDTNLSFTADAEITLTAKTDDDLIFVLVQDQDNVLWYKQTTATGDYQNITIARDDFSKAGGQSDSFDWANVRTVYVGVQGQNKSEVGTNSDGNINLDIKAIDINEDNSKASQTSLAIATIATQSIFDGSVSINLTDGESSASPVVTSTTTDVCTVSGTTVTFVSEGTCTIQATQAGDSNYKSATVSESFEIRDPRQTQTQLAIASIPQQDIGNGTVNADISNGESSESPVLSSTTPSICTVSGTTVTLEAEGTCNLKVTQAGDNTFLDASATTSFLIDDPSVDPIDQVITFAAIPNLLVGASTEVSAVGGSSGNEVVVTSLTTSICTVSGTTVSAVSVGTCTLEANQDGNALFNTAVAKRQSFDVYERQDSPVELVSPGDLTVGQTVAVTANAGLSTGNINFSSITSGVCSMTGNTLNAVSVGTCKIVATQDPDDNYNGSTDTVAVEVTEASTGAEDQTLLFPDIGDQEVGTTVALLFIAGESGNPVEVTSLTEENCTVSDLTETGVSINTIKAGSCVIQATQAGNSSYNRAEVTKNFTISGTESVWNVDLVENFQSGTYRIYKLNGTLVRQVYANTASDLEATRLELSQGSYIMMNQSNIYRAIR